MITEKDIIDAWLYWYKSGLKPPPIKDIEEFKHEIRSMHVEFKHIDKSIFWLAVIYISKNTKRWPTVFVIQSEINSYLVA